MGLCQIFPFSFAASYLTFKVKLKSFVKRKAERRETERITSGSAAKRKRIHDTPKPLEKNSNSGERP